MARDGAETAVAVAGGVEAFETPRDGGKLGAGLADGCARGQTRDGTEDVGAARIAVRGAEREGRPEFGGQGETGSAAA